MEDEATISSQRIQEHSQWVVFVITEKRPVCVSTEPACAQLRAREWFSREGGPFCVLEKGPVSLRSRNSTGAWRCDEGKAVQRRGEGATSLANSTAVFYRGGKNPSLTPAQPKTWMLLWNFRRDTVQWTLVIHGVSVLWRLRL